MRITICFLINFCVQIQTLLFVVAREPSYTYLRFLLTWGLTYPIISSPACPAYVYSPGGWLVSITYPMSWAGMGMSRGNTKNDIDKCIGQQTWRNLALN